MKQIFIFMITALLLSGCERTPTSGKGLLVVPANTPVFQDRLKDGSLGPKMVSRLKFFEKKL